MQWFWNMRLEIPAPHPEEPPLGGVSKGAGMSGEIICTQFSAIGFLCLVR